MDIKTPEFVRDRAVAPTHFLNFTIVSPHWWVRRALQATVTDHFPGASIMCAETTPSPGPKDRQRILITDQPHLEDSEPFGLFLKSVPETNQPDWCPNEMAFLGALKQLVATVVPDHDLGSRRRSGPGTLTRRQRDVLMCLAQGHGNAAIAHQLGMSENTVRIHVSAVLKSLGLENRTQAALWARQNPERVA
jgi:DNA-binding CsgD family transcriptional regulator